VGGPRSEMLLRPNATFELAEKLQRGAVSFGEIYSFISGLYFRGKVAYAHAFADAPSAVPSALIIVPGLGLIPLDTPVSSDQLTAIGSVSIESDNRAFRTALVRDAQRLDQSAGLTCSFVLLGSIASDKYTEPLLEVFGERLVFPADFVGRGDMSRGGLMLRSAGAGVELSYVPVLGAVRRGSRPPKLAPLHKR
jgi:hypothetical protein